MANKAGEDYSLARVPQSARRPFYEVLILRIGSLACVSQVMLGAALGYGLTFWQAFWATMLGSVILQVVSWGLERQLAVKECQSVYCLGGLVLEN